MNTHKIILGDCIAGMKTMPAGCIQTCITSPPYFGLRDYQGGTEEIGQEETVEGYVEKMVEVFREIKRILRDDGTVWLNLGDSYMSAKGCALPPQTFANGNADGQPKDFVPPNRKDQKGLKTKDLIGIPWRVAFALQADGWYLRQDIIWNKPNPMPESVTDRCTKSHEYIFLLSKKSHYFFDSNAIAEPTTAKAGAKWEERKAAGAQAGNVIVGDKIRNGTQRVVHGKGVTKNLTRHDGLRNKRSVWVVTTKPFRGAHFATFPKDLIEPCVLAGTSEQGCCSKCGAPHVRIIEKGETPNRTPRADNLNVIPGRDKLSRLNSEEMETIPKKTIGWEKTCKCADAEVVPCVVFDPFTGSGTTAVVALLNGRDYIGIELNPEYIKIAEDRIKDEVPQTLKGMFEQSDTQ